MMNKKKFKQMQKTNKLLRLITLVLSLVLLTTSSVNLVSGARKTKPEPDSQEKTTISTTVPNSTQKP